MSPTIEKTIYELHHNSSRPLAVFIGSGLSISAPSSLPLVTEAITSLLNLDWVDGEEKFPINKLNTTHSKIFDIRFEHILSIFNEWGRHNIGHLLKQFADAEPNWYHNKIAELSKKNLIKFIITTNFDTCLEKAFINMGCDCKCIIEENDNLENSPLITNIFKIHGTIKSSNNEYQALGLCADLESIFIPDKWKSDILLNILNNYTLVFLGYGGYDSFDINYILKKSPNASLFWVAHIHNNSTNISTEIIDILKAKNGRVLESDTAQFLGGKSLPPRKERFVFNKTYNINRGYHPSNFIGRVFQSIDEYNNAKIYFEEVLTSSKCTYYNLDIYDLIRNLAVSLSETSNYEFALIQLLDLESLIDKEVKSQDGETVELYLLLEQYLLLYEELSYVSKALGLNEKAFQYMIIVEDVWKTIIDMNIDIKHLIRLLQNYHTLHLNYLNLDNEDDWSKLIFALGDCEKSYRMSLARGDILSLIHILFKLFLIYYKAEDFESSQVSILEMIYFIKKLNSNIGIIQDFSDNIAKKFSNIELEKEFEKIDNYIKKKVNEDKYWFIDDEKLHNFLQGLKVVKGQPELEWPQWNAVAKIFELSNQIKLALEAYKISLKHLKESNFANEIEKTDWELNIIRKIDKLKNDSATETP